MDKTEDGEEDEFILPEPPLVKEIRAGKVAFTLINFLLVADRYFECALIEASIPILTTDVQTMSWGTVVEGWLVDCMVHMFVEGDETKRPRLRSVLTEAANKYAQDNKDENLI